MAKKAAKKSAAKKTAGPKLLSGDNPQIPKGYGDAPVEAYIAAIPGWKSGVARTVDTLIMRALPKVKKAVKYNSPLYGLDGETWFVSVHVFARYVKVAFFKGALLAPPPPGTSKQKYLRYLDIHEDDEIDEAQFKSWVKAASKLPGEKL